MSAMRAGVLLRLSLLILAGAVGAAVTLSAAGCALCRPHVVAAGGLYVRYFYSSELHYHEITVEAAKLTYTYYVAPDSLRWVIQAPCYADSDLKTVTTTLSESDVRELARAVNRSGFLTLPDTCGVTGPWQRYYPYVVTTAEHRGGVEKTVVYRSAPQASAAPDPFLQVAASLAAVVKRSFGREVVLPHNPAHSTRPARPKPRPR